MEINCLTKLGITQAALMTLMQNFKNLAAYEVGESTCVVGGDAEKETWDAQVGGWTRVVATSGNRVAGAAG